MCPCLVVHKWTLLMNSSLLHRRFSACLTYLSCVLCAMEISYRNAAVLFDVASRFFFFFGKKGTQRRNSHISSLFYKWFVRSYILQSYSDIEVASIGKIYRFNLSDFHSISIAVHALSMRNLTLLSADEMLLPMSMNGSTSPQS